MTDAPPSWAVPGRKVVCIDDDQQYWHNLLPGEITKGSIYTIESVVMQAGGPLNPEPVWCAILVGIVRKGGGSRGVGHGFRLTRFRPLVESTEEQDVAIFAPLLHVNTTKETV